MKTVEERVHEALTRLAAALDWNAKLHEALRDGEDHPMAQVAADQEVRAALTLLDSCWSYCESCRDRTWIEDLMWSKDADRMLCGACHQEAHVAAHGPGDPVPYPHEVLAEKTWEGVKERYQR
jgi:hypothetical protein